MNAAVDTSLVELGEFFAPASFDVVDGLVAEYQRTLAKLNETAEIMKNTSPDLLEFFFSGNKSDSDSIYRLERLFKIEGAIKALNSSFWGRALGMTQLLEIMPQARRDEWYNLIHEHKTPDFEEQTVRDTLMDLSAMRVHFLAEKVDGMFRALSGAHVTNRPEGWGKRCIISRVLDQFGYINSTPSGHIHDLRCVIARLMGNEEPCSLNMTEVINEAKTRPGKWVLVDGGAFRIRVYLGVGTAHLEIHSSIAWRLNMILAQLYPMAIPPKFRTKPKRAAPEFVLMERILPRGVRNLLRDAKLACNFEETNRGTRAINIPNTVALPGLHIGNKAGIKEAEQVLEALGGVKERSYFSFDYNALALVKEIALSGCIPDESSHQFYPTPVELAQRVVNAARITPDCKVLEPSAGLGAIATFVPEEQLTCIEVSGMRCNVLKAKGIRSVIEADFLKWEAQSRFDKVVMNPPYSEGRWKLHIHHAASCLNVGGMIVALLPTTAMNNHGLEGFDVSFEGPFDDRFPGTSISVVMMKAIKCG